MAQRTVTTYYSDLTGTPITEEEACMRFSLDGVDYEIDLTRSEKARLRDALAPFTSVARELSRAASRGQTTAPGVPSEPASRAVREWAEENGFDVPKRGRLPEVIREAYRVAHPAE